MSQKVKCVSSYMTHLTVYMTVFDTFDSYDYFWLN